jgi:hypothetical protein
MKSPVPGSLVSARGLDVFGVAPCAQLPEGGAGLVERAHGDRAGAGSGGEASERELAERGLIALPEQIEHVGALREVVIPVVAATAAGGDGAAGAQELAPGARRRARVHLGGHLLDALTGFVEPARGDERVARDEPRVHVIGRRHARRRRDGVGQFHRPRELAAPFRQLGLDQPQRPVVPARCERVVRAVGVSRLTQRLLARLVVAAHQVDKLGRFGLTMFGYSGLLLSAQRAQSCRRAGCVFLADDAPRRMQTWPSVASATASRARADTVRGVRRCARPARG